MAASNNTMSTLTAMTSSMSLKAEEINCQLCCTSEQIKEFKMPGRCGHSFCTDCAKHYYTLKIEGGEFLKLSCPICALPELGEKNSENEIFCNELFASLSKYLGSDIMTRFQNVLEMHKKMGDPNFLRCPNMNCNYGFLKRANIKQEECPECNRSFCNECLQLWQNQHINMTCKDYSKWIMDNCIQIADQISIKIDEKAENMSKCPKCHFKFILIRGDCLHLTCETCGAEYCNFCSVLFTRDTTCCKSNYGLHAHHPRNCHYYLRDFDIKELQEFLQMNAIAFDSRPPEDLVFHRNNPEAYLSPKDQRYLEYLSELIKSNGLDPVHIMSLHNIKQELQRHKLPNPESSRGPYEEDDAFLKKCRALLQEKVPLFHK